jgi:hypothetical protein
MGWLDQGERGPAARRDRLAVRADRLRGGAARGERPAGGDLRDAGGKVLSIWALDILDGRTQAIRALTNPDKLGHVGPVADARAVMHEAYRARQPAEPGPERSAHGAGQDGGDDSGDGGWIRAAPVRVGEEEVGGPDQRRG